MGSAATLRPRDELGAIEHIGLLYDGPERYVAGVTSYVRAALDAGDDMLVAVPPANLALVANDLGPAASHVTLTDMTVAGRNPGRIIGSVLLPFAAKHEGRRVSIVGEPIWAGRTADEYPACVIHEALINTAFAGRDASILCPYDTGRLDPETVSDAHRTHPTMSDARGPFDSTQYVHPLTAVAEFNRPLPLPVGVAGAMAYAELHQLADVRWFVAAQAIAAGLSANRVADMTVAINELASNTLSHTINGGRVSVWTESGTLVCQVDDGGHLTDPLVGRRPAALDQAGGRGLLLVHQLCDLVRIYTRPGHTSVRVHVRL